MPAPLKHQIAILEDRLNKALEHENWQSGEINRLRDAILEYKEKIELLDRDKAWLKQLCQEQSSSIASYMRSR